MVASCTKVKDLESFKMWVNHLPKKFSIDYRKNIFKMVEKNMYVLWTLEDGIKII